MHANDPGSGAETLRASENSEPKKTLTFWTWTLLDCVKVLRRVKRMACQRLKREQQRAALTRWRRAPCLLIERSVAAARGREAQLWLPLQTLWARVKVAVRGDKRRHLQEHVDRATEAADNGNVDEVYTLLKLWMKPHYKAPPRIKLDNGHLARTPGEAAEQSSLKYEATFKEQVTTRVGPATDREKRAASREACWGITPPTVDEVLDLILSAARGKAHGEDGITAEVFGAGGRPMAQLLQPLFAGVCLQKGPAHRVERVVSWQPSRVERIRERGVTLHDHVGKILRRWTGPKILQIEPLLVARSQATGSALRGAVMT